MVDETQCGIISESLFSINIDSYLRSLSGNSCLFKKISVDKNGNVKNCPSFQHSYGNIRETDIISVHSKNEYQFISNIKKDDILICKDCEFRIICTDCRAYKKDPNNIFSQPEKCMYNPYIAKWQREQYTYIAD